MENSREIWNTKVLALIGAAISQKYHELFKKDSQCSKKQRFALVVLFSTDQSVFYDLQEFLQVSFEALKLKSTHVI